MIVAPDHPLPRQGMLLASKFVWRESQDRIGLLVEELTPYVGEKGLAKLVQSREILAGLYEALISNDYENHEDRNLFTELCRQMNDVFKNLYRSYMTENPGALRRRNGKPVPINDAKISEMSTMFRYHISWRLGLSELSPVRHVYPEVTPLVKSLRNNVEHEDAPTDHITGETSFGNLYTFCSVFILSVYAYLEMLQTWLDAEKLKGQTHPGTRV